MSRLLFVRSLCIGVLAVWLTACALTPPPSIPTSVIVVATETPTMTATAAATNTLPPATSTATSTPVPPTSTTAATPTPTTTRIPSPVPPTATAARTVSPVRTTSDQPDELKGYLVHVMYVVPSAGTDRALDVNGALANSVAKRTAVKILMTCLTARPSSVSGILAQSTS